MIDDIQYEYYNKKKREMNTSRVEDTESRFQKVNGMEKRCMKMFSCGGMSEMKEKAYEKLKK